MKTLFLACKRLNRELNRELNPRVKYGFVWNKVTQNIENRFIEDIDTFSLTYVFEKALSQLKLFNALLMRPVFASSKCQASLEYGGG